MLRHGSLFSGIGGFDIAANWVGWQNIFSCEQNPFCRSILEFYWPKATHYEDIFEFSAAGYDGKVDIISGGFPCQPFSLAGKRNGKEDDRYLFPQACRIIREVRPRWIVLENVAGLFSILEPECLSEMEVKAVELFCKDQDADTLANQTIIKLQRRVIGSIIDEIIAAGYVLPTLEDGTPIILCLPAAAVGAPHQRDRIWFVAHSNCYGNEQHQGDNFGSERKQAARGPKEQTGKWGTGFTDRLFDLSHLAKKDEANRDKNPYATANFKRAFQPASSAAGFQIPNWKDWPSQSPFCGGDDGLPDRLDGTSFSAWRAASVKAYGNAIVPQVALEIFRAIQAVEISLSVR